MDSEKIDYTLMPGEQSRLQELRELDLVGTLPEESFDRITRIIQRVFRTGACAISLITEDKQWFKSCLGLPPELEEARSTKREVSLCQYVVAYREPFIVHNALEDPRFKHNDLLQKYTVRFYAGVPLVSSRGNVLGSLFLMDGETREWAEADTDLLVEFSQWVMSEIELRHKNRLLDRMSDQLRMLSYTDSLTGMYNRRFLEELLGCSRYSGGEAAGPVSAVMIDVDHFKQFNDTYGHIAGDHCLRQVAQVMASVFHHDTCKVARYGGEEFVAVLDNTSAETAMELAELVRREVRSLQIPHSASPVSSFVTLSIGVASVDSAEAPVSEQLIYLADEALYAAKQAGRDRISLSAKCTSS
ncbi:sensor domain-containing diguanylate cyclase [Paenibacillus tarimensis]|uniref:sensor domain-containing diguanylate cyclase n=1 Tax=Paenibacillus tarimensis TaxID=416012 RepID=UPI001F433872|nr:diguanylate cyclase [Paenibacillus tarimensis]MCF2945706.1 diguanylate cyclase [Paenibacillus tarimensis]